MCSFINDQALDIQWSNLFIHVMLLFEIWSSMPLQNLLLFGNRRVLLWSYGPCFCMCTRGLLLPFLKSRLCFSTSTKMKFNLVLTLIYIQPHLQNTDASIQTIQRDNQASKEQNRFKNKKKSIWLSKKKRGKKCVHCWKTAPSSAPWTETDTFTKALHIQNKLTWRGVRCFLLFKQNQMYHAI